MSTGYFLDCNPDEVIKKGEKMVKKGEKVAKSVKMWLNLGPWMAHSTLELVGGTYNLLEGSARPHQNEKMAFLESSEE